LSNANIPDYFAPFNVQDVEQVIVVPRSQALQAPTHCDMSFRLNELYSLATQLLVEPVTSSSDEHAASASAANKAMMVRYGIAIRRGV
jgi:hypothetical protein